MLPTIDFARGDATGTPVPAHPDALLAGGPELLTRAFHAYGSLAADDAVVAITRSEAVGGGNSGLKLALTIRTARGAEHALFAKFSRDLTDPFRDRRRGELEAEVRLADLSRLPAFSVAVARPWFADFAAASGTGVLITDRIAFGAGPVLPLRTKCRDHELPDRMEYYRAVVTALARLAAAYRAGRLSPQVDALFPYDRGAAMAELPIAVRMAPSCAPEGRGDRRADRQRPAAVPARSRRTPCSRLSFVEDVVALRHARGGGEGVPLRRPRIHRAVPLECQYR